VSAENWHEERDRLIGLLEAIECGKVTHIDEEDPSNCNRPIQRISRCLRSVSRNSTLAWVTRASLSTFAVRQRHAACRQHALLQHRNRGPTGEAVFGMSAQIGDCRQAMLLRGRRPDDMRPDCAGLPHHRDYPEIFGGGRASNAGSIVVSGSPRASLSRASAYHRIAAR